MEPIRRQENPVQVRAQLTSPVFANHFFHQYSEQPHLPGSHSPSLNPNVSDATVGNSPDCSGEKYDQLTKGRPNQQPPA
jgi:hypothetical protein